LTIKGSGVEVGAGSRPFPIPDNAQCYYGDIRDKSALEAYFSTEEVTCNGFIDAQTMNGIKSCSLDFVISAHVIEHLFDPIGSIQQTMRCLKVGGIFLLVVPEMTATWDRRRSATTLAHLLHDWVDAGEGTKFQAYEEHLRFVHPELTGESLTDHEIAEQAAHGASLGLDIHVHAWGRQDFLEILDFIGKVIGFTVESVVPVQNENIFVLKKS
jgi:SAM-dependent methyltransferase